MPFGKIQARRGAFWASNQEKVTHGLNSCRAPSSWS